MIPGRTLTTPLQPWSWSALDSFETCPYRHHQIKVVKKVKERTNPQMSAGLKTHNLLEKRIKTGRPLPKDLAAIEPKIQALEAMPGVLRAEEELAVDVDFNKVDWFDKNVWIRVKLDAQVDMGTKLVLVDWKTGKMKDDWGQLTMAAHLKFQMNPRLQEIGMMFVWTKYNDKSKEIVTREDAAIEWAHDIIPRLKRFQAAYDNNEFPVKPSGLCRKHCPVTSCVHNGQ